MAQKATNPTEIPIRRTIRDGVLFRMRHPASHQRRAGQAIPALRRFTPPPRGSRVHQPMRRQSCPPDRSRPRAENPRTHGRTGRKADDGVVQAYRHFGIAVHQKRTGIGTVHSVQESPFALGQHALTPFRGTSVCQSMRQYDLLVKKYLPYNILRDKPKLHYPGEKYL